MDNFFENVYQIVKKIPRGRVTTYGAIASFLGVAKSSRMVGMALTCSHKSFISIPSHRVVNRNGVLTGKNHFGSNDEMKLLLEAEGLKILNDQILDFQNYFWDPNIELI